MTSRKSSKIQSLVSNFEQKSSSSPLAIYLSPGSSALNSGQERHTSSNSKLAFETENASLRQQLCDINDRNASLQRQLSEVLSLAEQLELSLKSEKEKTNQLKAKLSRKKMAQKSHSSIQECEENSVSSPSSSPSSSSSSPSPVSSPLASPKRARVSPLCIVADLQELHDRQESKEINYSVSSPRAIPESKSRTSSFSSPPSSPTNNGSDLRRHSSPGEVPYLQLKESSAPPSIASSQLKNGTESAGIDPLIPSEKQGGMTPAQMRAELEALVSLGEALTEQLEREKHLNDQHVKQRSAFHDSIHLLTEEVHSLKDTNQKIQDQLNMLLIQNKSLEANAIRYKHKFKKLYRSQSQRNPLSAPVSSSTPIPSKEKERVSREDSKKRKTKRENTDALSTLVIK